MRTLLLRTLTRALDGVDWTESRRLAWQITISLAAGYATYKPALQWAVPTLTLWAGLSKAPGGPPASLNPKP